MTKLDLPPHLLDIVVALGGSVTVLEASREFWQRHEPELRVSGDLFYTWQYELRWAAQELRDSGKLAATGRGASSRWALP